MIYYLVIGADILDKTNQNAFSFGRLREEPTWFQLEDHQLTHFREVSNEKFIFMHPKNTYCKHILLLFPADAFKGRVSISTLNICCLDVMMERHVNGVKSFNSFLEFVIDYY